MQSYMWRRNSCAIIKKHRDNVVVLITEEGFVPLIILNNLSLGTPKNSKENVIRKMWTDHE